MKINRRFTHSGQNAFDSVTYDRRTSRISNPDGSVVFEMNDAEIPAQWSQLATDIMVSKLTRTAKCFAITRETSSPVRKKAPSKSSTAWQDAGATGVKNTATSIP